jgi:hypothetical protein
MKVRSTIASLGLVLFLCTAAVPMAQAAVRPDPTAVESVRSVAQLRLIHPDPHGCSGCVDSVRSVAHLRLIHPDPCATGCMAVSIRFLSQLRLNVHPDPCHGGCPGESVGSPSRLNLIHPDVVRNPTICGVNCQHEGARLLRSRWLLPR